MVEWLAGNRVRGTSVEKPVLGLPSGSVGGWKEVGRTTAGSTITDLDVTGFDDKRYYMVLGNLFHNGSQDVTMRCGQASTLDISNNYASRRSENGGSDTISHTRPNMILADIQSSTQSFGVNYFANKSTKEKLQLGHMIYQGTAGAGNVPDRTETANKWANTSNALDSLSYDQGSWLSGSEMVVLGYDPADTHTDNFWEQLGSSSTVTSNAIDVSLSAEKKYLWVQGYLKQGSGTSGSLRMRVGNSSVDTGSNYVERFSENGATDDTSRTNQTALKAVVSDGAGSAIYQTFFNLFIINNASKEKLMIGHAVHRSNTGTGTAPNRIESVSKWTNTSDQIDVMKFYRTNDTLDSGLIKVWGSD